MLEGTKRLFPTDYAKFKKSMLSAAENDDLPATLQLDELGNFTLKDFQDMFSDFISDTGLDIEGHLYFCPECNKLHLVVSVDNPDADQYVETILQ